MATGYQDWHSLTFLEEKSASLYFADVFRMLIEWPVIVSRKVIVEGAVYYIWGSVVGNSDGRLIGFGSIQGLGD